MNRDRSERRTSARSTRRPSRSNNSGPNHERKTLQLCRQAEHALHGAVFELQDPLLENLALVEVTSPPGDSRLCVVFRQEPANEKDERHDVDIDVQYEHLAAARGALRAAITEAIHRRHTPQLTFVILPAIGQGSDDE